MDLMPLIILMLWLTFLYILNMFNPGQGTCYYTFVGTEVELKPIHFLYQLP